MESSCFELHARIEDTHWWFTARRVVLDRLLTHHLTGRGRLLEVGCGTGGNLAMLARHGEAIGLDQDEAAVAHARAKTGATVFCGSVTDALDLPRPIAAVCLFDVLEHIDDDVAALTAAAGLLDGEGQAFITVPALPQLWSRHDDAFGHRRRYVRRELHDLIARAGLHLEHSSYFNSFLLPPIAAVRIVGRRLGLAGGNDFDIPAAGVNRALHAVFAAEAPLVVTRSLPLGASLLAVARV